MKKGWVSIAFLAILMGCNEVGRVESRVDSMGKSLDTSAEKMMDTVKSKWKDLKENIEDEVDGKKDSLSKQ